MAASEFPLPTFKPVGELHVHVPEAAQQAPASRKHGIASVVLDTFGSTASAARSRYRGKQMTTAARWRPLSSFRADNTQPRASRIAFHSFTRSACEASNASTSPSTMTFSMVSS